MDKTRYSHTYLVPHRMRYFKISCSTPIVVAMRSCLFCSSFLYALLSPLLCCCWVDGMSTWSQWRRPQLKCTSIARQINKMGLVHVGVCWVWTHVCYMFVAFMDIMYQSISCINLLKQSLFGHACILRIVLVVKRVNVAASNQDNHCRTN